MAKITTLTLQEMKENGEKINMMNGAICRKGRIVGIATPVNSTLTNRILFKERSFI